ncbi:hypothetical protein L596_020328 [Steinernema carpocapsae]|uniref:KH type-2 domain-containing protein n=1 Tax=Steinernema carpocapsae TaxID=34508 RepID=A0A4U5MT66_STECR|nr:hypothetical protein L596_020328 [Steinernema carpocapsae]
MVPKPTARSCLVWLKLTLRLHHDHFTSNVTGFLTENSIQLAVVDSPGTVGIQHAKKVVGTHSEDAILTHPEKALEKADHILVVQDATAVGDYIHHRVLHLLHRYPHLKSSLVINKIDLIERRSDLLRLVQILTEGQVGGQVIKTTQNTIGKLGKATIPLHNRPTGPQTNDEKWMEKYRKCIAKPTHRCPWSDTKHLFVDVRGWDKFSSVFYVSALTGEGIDGLRSHLMSLAEPSEWRVDESTLTTKEPQEICKERVRAALLDELPSDVAYKLKISICEWELVGDVLQIIVDIKVDKPRIAHLVLGKSGSKIATIGRVVNKHLQNLFQQQLFVRLHVKLDKKIVQPMD